MIPNMKSALSDLLKYIPSAIIPGILGLTSVVVFTRIFSPEDYGIYILINTTVLFLQMLFFGWLNQSVLRYYTMYSNWISSFYSTTFFIYIFLIATFTVLWYGGQIIWNQFFDMSYYLFWVPPLLMAQAGGKMIFTITRARRQSIKYSVYISANSFIKFFFPILLFYLFDMDCTAIFIGVFISGLLILLYEGLGIYNMASVKIANYNFKIIKKFFNYGIPLVGFSIVSYILSASDRFMVGFFLGSHEVGVYSAGYQIAETSINLFANFLMLAFFPVIIQNFERGDQNETAKLMTNMISYYLIIVLPVLFGVVLLHREITTVMLGESFNTAYKILPTVSIGVFFLGLSMYYNKTFELKEKTIFILGITGFTSIINVILNIVLIPIIGIDGAAFSTLCSYLLAFSLSAIIGTNLINWAFPWRLFFRALFYCIVMCAVILILPKLNSVTLMLILQIFFGAITYFSLILMFEKKIYSDLTGEKN